MATARRIGSIAAVTLGCVILLAAVALLLLNTNAAHRYVLKSITQHAEAAIGARVEIRGFSFHKGHLGADFYGVKIFSPEPASATPLLSVDRAGIDIGVNLFHAPHIGVQDIALDRPVLHLFVDSRGNSNLPHASSSSSGPSANLFDLAIGHFVLTGGEIFYNDRQIPIAADIHDLNARAEYESLKAAYEGTLSYRDGRVHYGALAPFNHSLELAFAAAASGVELKSMNLRSDNSWMKAQGTLTDYDSPSVSGTYEASLSAKDVANFIGPSPNGTVLDSSGSIDTNGKLAYKNKPGEPAIDGLSIVGTVRGRTLQLGSTSARFSVQSISSDYELKAGVLAARNLKADTLGGHVTAHLVISHLSGDAAARLSAVVQDIALPALQDALRIQKLPGIRLDGHLDGDLRANWHGNVQDLQLVSNARLAGTVGSTPGSGRPADSFALNGSAQVAYDGRTKIATIHNALLNAPHTHLNLDGSLGNNARVNVEARSDDLHEVDLLAQLFQPTKAASGTRMSNGPSPLNLGGMATFNGAITGPLTNPQFAGMFTATNLRVRGASVQFVQAKVEIGSHGVAARQGELKNGAHSNANFDVSIGLQDWHFTPQQPVTIHLSAEKVSVADLEHIAGFQYPVTGQITTAISVNGTAENPDVQGKIQLAQAELWQQPVQNLNVAFQKSGSRLVSTLNVQTPAGSATGTVSYDPESREYEVQANAAEIQLNRIQYLQEKIPDLTGVIGISSHGSGSLQSPQLDLTIDGQQLQIGEQKLDNFKAQATVAQQRANFDVGCSISGATLRTHGSVNLTGDYQASADIDSQVVQLGPLLQTWLPQAGADLRGQTEFHATLTGPLKDPNRLEAHLEVPSLQIGYPSIQFAASGPIRTDYKQGMLTLARSELTGAGTDVTFEGNVPLQGAAALQATANGTMDLRLLQIWDSQLTSSGQIKLKVEAQGSRAHPDVSGTVTMSDAAVSMENVPEFDKINAELDVTGGNVQVKSFTGQLGGGTFEVHGSATYRPNVRYNLGMTAKDVRLLYPDGVRTQLGANLNFTGQPDESYLTGQVTVDGLSLTQSFDLSTFSNQFNGPESTPSGSAQNIKLNIALTSRQQLELASNQLSLQGTADLQVRGTAAEPVLIGRTNLTSGEFFFNGRRFEVENAAIEFSNPVRTTPVIDLTAKTTVDQFDITVNLVGPFDRLRTTYTSDPPLAPVDVINLLITGQTTEAAQSSPSTPESVIAGQVAGQVSDRLQKLTGISSLTIDPQIGGNQGNGASQLAIQERVTKNLFFTFATDVTTTQGEVVQVEYQVSRKYSMSAIRDQTGGYEVEIKSRKRF